MIIPGFKVSDGVLVGTQDRAEHGLVGRVYLPTKDVVMSFRFKLAGSPRFNVVLVAAEPARVELLRRELDAWRLDVRAEMMQPNPDHDPQIRPATQKKRKTK